MLGFSIGELVLIGFIGIILFGDKNLPSHLRKLVTWISAARGFAAETQRSWLDVKSQVTRNLLLENTLLEEEPLSKRTSELTSELIQSSVASSGVQECSESTEQTVDVNSPSNANH